VLIKLLALGESARGSQRNELTEDMLSID